LLDSEIIEKNLERRKKSSVRLLLAGILLLISCLVLRFVPEIDDAISGKPEPIRAIAEGTVRKIADRIGGDFAVILLNAGNQDCRRTRLSPAFDSDDDTYYIVSYSEALHSVCVTLYGQPTTRSDMSSERVLAPTTGRNYGRHLSAPVKVVAIDNTYTTYPNSYLSLLNWRAKIDSSSFAKVGRVRTYQAQTSPEGKAWLGVNVDFADLCAMVARRHNTVDAVLNGLITLCLGVIGFAAASVGLIYRRFSQLCLSYGSRPGLGAFMRKDPGAIIRRARETARLKQQQDAERARAAILSKRAKEAVVHKIEAVLANTPEGPERDRIQQCLRRENSEEMKILLGELRSQPDEKTPEEKVVALLETLKEYCTVEELQRCCDQTFEMFTKRGFREARTFAVEMHDQFRARFKQAQQEESEEAARRRATNESSAIAFRTEQR
jgi:hypothetical protein